MLSWRSTARTTLPHLTRLNHPHYAHTSTARSTGSRVYSSAHSSSSGSDSGAASADEPDCPELPSTPSWSLKTLMARRDAISTSPDHSDDITPATIDHLLSLAHLRKPTDPQVLQRLERDVRRMRNFLDYIRSTEYGEPPAEYQQSSPSTTTAATMASASIDSLRSLVDDGEGLRLRVSPPTSPDATEKEQEEREALQRRDVLLRRPKRAKGNFFVVDTALDKEVS